MGIAPYIRLTSLTSSAYAPSSRGPHWSERGLCTLGELLALLSGNRDHLKDD